MGQLVSEPNIVLEQIRQVLRTGPKKDAIQRIVELLRNASDSYSWVGVYLVRNDELVLEGYAGDSETEHVTIPLGQGICGFAAKEGETVIVQDVSKDPRYLMCFPSTRSEIVVPIMGRNGAIGEIDIDSDRLAAFSKSDRNFLEMAAREMAEYLDTGS